MDSSLFQSSILPWIGFNVFVLALLALDLGVFHKGAREIKVGEALKLSALYIALALIFNAGVFYVRGAEVGLQFLTGYLIEKSLSLDNIFVIAMIFTHFGVPAKYQHRVLFWGILGALVMRATLIAAGSALVTEFQWILYIFGAFLIFTGIKMMVAGDEKPDLSENMVFKFLKRHMRITETIDNEKFFVRRKGVLFATPLFIVLVLVEFTDLIFAVDSIPAIFAITTDPFIVYTSNVFAILGLRALYFALADIIPRFHLLKYGLAIVLMLVGVKLALVNIYKIPTLVTLGLTVGIIGGSILLSFLRPKKET